jgi:hypothetical protein
VILKVISFLDRTQNEFLALVLYLSFHGIKLFVSRILLLEVQKETQMVGEDIFLFVFFFQNKNINKSLKIIFIFISCPNTFFFFLKKKTPSKKHEQIEPYLAIVYMHF